MPGFGPGDTEGPSRPLKLVPGVELFGPKDTDGPVILVPGVELVGPPAELGGVPAELNSDLTWLAGPVSD